MNNFKESIEAKNVFVNSPDDPFLPTISVIVEIAAFDTIFGQAAAHGHQECGGLLGGHWLDDNTVLISIASNPPVDSAHQADQFRRGGQGVQQLLEEWERQAKREYVGEWHTHPSGVPYPSPQDEQAMLDIAKLDEGLAPVLIIAAGTKWHFEHAEARAAGSVGLYVGIIMNGKLHHLKGQYGSGRD